MSVLRRIELNKDNIFITLEVTKKEYEMITPEAKEFIILPTSRLNRTLTTGKIGNGNRIMIPNKLLKKHDMDVLKKHVQSRITDIGDRKFLIIELEDKRSGIPVFKEE